MIRWKCIKRQTNTSSVSLKYDGLVQLCLLLTTIILEPTSFQMLRKLKNGENVELLDQSIKSCSKEHREPDDLSHFHQEWQSTDYSILYLFSVWNALDFSLIMRSNLFHLSVWVWTEEIHFEYSFSKIGRTLPAIFPYVYSIAFPIVLWCYRWLNSNKSNHFITTSINEHNELDEKIEHTRTIERY